MNNCLVSPNRLSVVDAVTLLLIMKKYRSDTDIYKDVRRNIDTFVNLLDLIKLTPDSLYSAGYLLRNNQLTPEGFNAHRKPFFDYLKTCKLNENSDRTRVFEPT